MNKVYGVYEGSIYEGGGIREPLYLIKEDAINRALELFEVENKRWEKTYGNETDKDLIEINTQFKWKKIEDKNRWCNQIEEIEVVEYEVVESKVAQNPSFYDSNSDSMITPKKPGWYVNWKNESGDTCISLLPREPSNCKEAYDMIVEYVADWDCISEVLTYAEVK